MPRRPGLAALRKTLGARHGTPSAPPTRDPFELILWEQVAYLAKDDKRLRAFRSLEQRVGLAPKAIAAASTARLQLIARSGGGTAFAERAERMQLSARRVLAEWGGRLADVLALPFDEAVKALASFPMIGKPGAEKILLLTGSQPVLALDSNGMRVLVRVGFGADDARYEKTYASVREATRVAARRLGVTGLRELHLLLRAHGQLVCRGSKPACDDCPLSGGCLHAAG